MHMISKVGSYDITQYTKPSPVENEKKSSYLDNFQTRVINSSDLTDTIVVPRTIFKGYLGIMLGTSLATLGAFLSKPKKLSQALKLGGLGLSTYGTWAFVRPYIVKGKGVETEKSTTS